jgi:hypothetical protein
MPCRLVYKFRDNTSQLSSGWVETWYTSDGASQDCINKFGSDAVRQARRGILSKDYDLVAIRASVVGTRADQAGKVWTHAQGVGRYTTAAPDPSAGEQPWDALLIKCQQGGTVLRSFAMRGIPEGVMKDTLNYNPVPAFSDALTIWAQTFQGAGTLQVRQATYSLLPRPDTITYDVFSQRYLILTYTGAPPGALVRGVVIRISGITGASPVNHLWRVRQVTGGVVTLFPGRRTIFGTINSVGAVVELQTLKYTTIQSLAATRGTKRNTGRFPDQLRGRARARTA